jgi:hypothetical protein
MLLFLHFNLETARYYVSDAQLISKSILADQVRIEIPAIGLSTRRSTR